MQTAEEAAAPLDHQPEYGDLNFEAPECLLRVPEGLGPGWREGGRDCNG
jgi:hypothetical protein